MPVNKKTVLNENRVCIHARWTEKRGNQIRFDWLIESDASSWSFPGASKKEELELERAATYLRLTLWSKYHVLFCPCRQCLMIFECWLACIPERMIVTIKQEKGNRERISIRYV